MTGLVSYGGDASVTVARGEIERITSSLANVQSRLIDELHPLSQFTGLIHHLQLDVYLPETLVKLGLQRHGCFVASESYFTAEARVAHQLSAVAEAVHSQPWIQKLIPPGVWLAAAGIVGISAFSNSNLTSLSVRTMAGQAPLKRVGELAEKLPNSEIQIIERPPAAVNTTPNSLGGLASRLNNQSGNIRIESYQSPTGRVLVMYLPGTAEWSPLGRQKAFDVRSNLELLSGGEKSNSYRAADAALSAFGATSRDRLILVGYSQGGMVAAELAQHHPNVVGLVTLGSPVANEQLPNNLAVISLEHTNDVVPAISGTTNPMTENWATGSRHIEINPGESVLKAHEIGKYQGTAALADSSNDEGLARVRQEILGNLPNSRAEVVREFAPLKATS